MENLLANSQVCFTVYHYESLRYQDDAPYACNISANFQSVVVLGEAKILTDPAQKRQILYTMLQKYQPVFAQKPMLEASIAATCVIEIAIDACTYKENHA